MNLRSSFFKKTTVIATIWLLNFVVTSSAFVCPPSDEIAPCTCTVNELTELGSIFCRGSKVTQKDIDRVFPALLSANANNNKNKNNSNNTGLEGASPALHLHELTISLTNLATLDLTSLVNVSSNLTLRSLAISYNFELEEITGPNPKSTSKSESGLSQKIVTEYIELYSNSLLTNEGLSNFFPHFNSSVRYLAITYTNNLAGGRFPIPNDNDNGDEDESSEFDFEFLPGLASLTNLQQLYLNNNNFSYIGGGQFRRNRNLQIIGLSNNGQSITIGDDAFLLNPPDVSPPSNPLLIDLTFSKLTTSSFNGSSSTSTFLTQRPTGVVLSGNAIESVEQRVFEQFLFAFERNTLEFSGNPIQCDSKGRWLKEQRESFENWVLGVSCSNDPGYTIFTSDLV